MTSPINTAHGRALEAAATPGKWVEDNGNLFSKRELVARFRFEGDAPFIAYLRTHAVALLDAADERDRLRAAQVDATDRDYALMAEERDRAIAQEHQAAAVLGGFVGDLERVEAERDRLRGEVKELKRQLTFAIDNNHRRNVELDALHYVWCDGGCDGGVHRWTPDALTPEVVEAAVDAVNRMVSWSVNNDGRAVRKYGIEPKWVRAERLHAAEARVKEIQELRAENERLRVVISWYLEQWPCPQIHADTITNQARRCPEDSDDPEEWCASAKFRAALGRDRETT